MREAIVRVIRASQVRELAEQSGLVLQGVTSAEGLVPDESHLRGWQAAGRAGEMRYMNRDPGLLASPKRLLSTARSIVSFGFPYSRAPAPERPKGWGRVARYAWGKDYHDVAPALMEQFVERVKKSLDVSFDYRAFTDAVPLLERAVASRAGLGFQGKNTMVIVPRTGSFLFLGEVLWSLEVEDDETRPANKSTCGSCERCMTSCPTGAIVGPRELDARRCISYLTIEKRGSFSDLDAEALGEWIYGCDICQDVCPFNAAPLRKPTRLKVLPEFESAAGTGPLLNLADILRIETDDGFRKRFRGTPLVRTKREGLLRNAAAVAANTGAEVALEDLEKRASADTSAVIRHAALSAGFRLARLSGTAALDSMRQVAQKLRTDPDIALAQRANDLLDHRR